LNSATIWQDFLRIATQEVGSRVVETWFKAISLSHLEPATKTIYLKAPNAFIRDWVAGQYSEFIKTQVGRLLNEKQMNLIVLDESRTDVVPVSQTKEKPIPVVNKMAAPSGSSAARSTIQSRYLFDNFVVGPHNAVAVGVAHSVVRDPGSQYNPLYIHGGAGLGKTHLLQAVGNAFKREHPQKKVIYLCAERFVYEFVTAVRLKRVAAFEQRYREADLLLVDDIQSMAHKEQTQEAFLHIFNALYESGKQLVFSSDALPQDIEGLDTRLCSRLDGALITDIQAPTVETKIEIIQKKAAQQRGAVEDDVARFIAGRVTSNIRELEGLLIRVLAFATFTHQALTLDLAHKVIKPMALEQKRQAVLDLPQIAHAVAKYYGFSVPELRSSKRQSDLVLTRHVAMYFMKTMTQHSLRDIAAYWCRKDHATVIHAVNKIQDMLSADERFKAELDRLTGVLRS
jgi:chromosomal replication initiator protein